MVQVQEKSLVKIMALKFLILSAFTLQNSMHFTGDKHARCLWLDPHHFIS
jgi:hypothetical protein